MGHCVPCRRSDREEFCAITELLIYSYIILKHSSRLSVCSYEYRKGKRRLRPTQPFITIFLASNLYIRESVNHSDGIALLLAFIDEV
jgi:hypothetical protein